MTRENINRDPRRRGMTLLVIVVLVMLISLSAYRYTFVMESEYRLTRLQEELVQARLSALSGIEYAAHLLEKPTSQRLGLTSPGTRERVFRRSTARDDSRSDSQSNRMSTWQFGLISPELENATPAPSASVNTNVGSIGLEDRLQWHWGIENESAKLSIPMMVNFETLRPGHFRSVLLALPGMDEEATDAFLDQLGVRRVNGANRQNTPISGAIDPSLRNEQRASRDRVRALWFGGDFNQNYRLDPIESQLMDKLSRSEAGAVPSRSGSSSDARWQPLKRYLTWMNGERNEQPNGSPRIYLNQPNLQQLHQQLLAVYPVEFANFVIAYRQYGPSNGPRNTSPGLRPSLSGSTTDPPQASPPQASPPRVSPPGVASPPSTTLPTPATLMIAPSLERQPSTRPSSKTLSRSTISSSDANSSQGSVNKTTPNEITISASEYVPVWTTPGTFMIQNPLDLVGATVSLPSEGTPSSGGGSTTSSQSASKPARAPKKVLRSPFSSDIGERRNYLGKWLSETTIVDATFRDGRVDVSEAPAEVLQGIPGIDAMLAQRIVEQRRSAANNPDAMNSIAWLLETGVVEVQKLRELEPFLTTRSDVYSVQSIGFRDNRSPVYRCTVTIDARRIPASVLDLKVWHPWDRGFDIDSLNGITP